MNHNDVLRSLRYMLKANDQKMAEIIKLSGLEVSAEAIATYVKKEEEPGFVRCPEKVMAHFLDGLVIHRRGRDDSRPPQPIEVPVTNNTVLKKLRVAFELKEDDLHAVLKSVDFPVSKPELSALFRKVGHDNYRPCGDQLLRNFLKGLTLRVRG
ncbi:uncharacterized protein YehS (DUF1456 family) [Pseudomonas sp. TE6288]|jgi:uncharacterized protein YehS (DUF1456 family)|uniref:DUF1456 family protein n=1 Tax=Pseudomonas soli TaxID=1306993 RepID=A0A2V4IFI8_9PSED|nr:MULTISPECIES: DUF1456 family protein [Pseudomonas]MBI6953106.1 DUF1456 family protein [Pseudomonas sp. CCOS 191]MDF9755510.1 uncharacterized protein YehS (DUF1456 family) [Pseudomonas hunanensis]PNA02912.1 DUF1456 domain-containing protein [Pseudomonas sp. FW305-42]PNA27642.1 DUF1456 domain-containing protein [Pseudomonas sp. MPR-R1B]PNB29640.1 DUF1456 domain-containing protein [Pseudomonas sp. DP16D-E2]